MGSLADCLKSTTVDKTTASQIRKLASKYAKTMPPAEADRRAAAELLDAAMSDMETLRSQLVGLGYDVAVQGGYAAQQDSSTAGATSAAEVAEAQRMWAEMGTESPYFKKWFGDSKVVDKQGKPRVVYHGSDTAKMTGDFSFQTGRKSKRYTTFSEHDVESLGFFFSPNEGDAGTYGDNVSAFYLSARNPLQNPAYLPLTSKSPQPEKDAVRKAWEDIEYILAPAMYEEGGARYIDTEGGVSRTEVDDDAEWLEKVFASSQIDWALLDNPEVVRRMKERGYDSVMVYEPNDEAGYSWFVTDPTQIKSVNNRGTFDANDPRILMQSATQNVLRPNQELENSVVGKWELVSAKDLPKDPRLKKHKRVVRAWNLENERGDAMGWATFSGDGELLKTGSDYITRPTQSALDRAMEDARKIAELRKTPGFNDADKYYRFGDLPENGRSRHIISGKLERGVSVYRAIANVFGNYSRDPDIAFPYYGMSLFDRPIYEVEGKRVGKGSDGEPILKDVQIVRQLPTSDVASMYGIRLPDANDPNTLNQNRWTVPSGAQGMISFGTRSGKPLIQLFESANESTFLHETGHLYLEMIRAMATQPNAPAPIVQIWNDTKAALGMESDDLSVKDHENWARNLEAYFMEGKTPSLGLRKAFTRYAEWLKNIYREAERIFTTSGTQMNEDLRPIFDRLFATEQEIKETEAFYEAQKPFFTAADQMAEEDRKKYDKLRNKAVESTHDKRLRQLTEASVKAQGGREAFTAEAREQVDRMPVYNAIESARAEGGIDVETLDELVGEKMRKELGKRWNKIGGAPIVVPAGGVDPELLASQHGYENALAMVQDMLAAPSKGQMVKDIVDSRVAQEREKIARGLLDGGTLPADEAYHNEDRMALLLAEFTLLADTMSKSAGARARAIDSAAVREVARQTLKSYTVSDAMDYMRFARAERKAAIESRLAKEKGDATKALEAKRREMLNHALFMESMQTRKDIAKIEAFMKRTAKQKNLGEDARELARGLGIQYGVIPFQGLTGDKAWQAYGAWFAEQEKERQTLEAWTAKYADLYAPYFDPFILSNAGAMSYRELTVEQFVSLRNAVDTIKAVDKQERTIQLAGEAQEREAFIKELAATLTDLKPKPQTRSYRKNKARKAIASYLANHTKAETLLQYLDNWNPDGPWSRLYRALADAEAEQTTRLKPASEELRRIFDPIKKNLGKKVTLPALNDSFTRGELFVAFLNMGNDGNLLRLKEGYGWNDAQLEAIKNELTKEEMDAAQAVWDFIDTFREESFAVEKRMNGRTPERVVPVPVATRNGIYRGGYFPISYDADLSETAFMREQKDLDQTLFGGRNYGAAQTKQGHLKERAAGGGGQAVALDLSVITNHVYNVIHDITHREAVVNVAKIIKDPEVKSLMETYLGIEGYREMWPWLQSVARDVQEPMNQLHRWARWARKGTTIMQMGLKITTMIQQPLGILQTVDVVGKEYTMRGLTYMYGQPSKFPEKARLVMEKSKFMENRVQAFDRDVRDAMKGLTLKDSVMQEVERFAYKGIGMAQMGVDLPTWWGAYEKAMQVEYKDVQDADAREKKAVAYADSAVRTSQGSGSTLDLSRIQRGGEFQRLLTMFYSYFNTLYNLTYRRAKQTASYKDVPQLAASAMLLWFLPAVLSDLVSGRGPDDDDEWLPWMAQKIGLYPLQMLVGVRDVANAAFGEFGYQLTPAESAPKSIVNWFKAVEKAIKEGEPERLVKPTAEAIGFIAHLPLKQPIITIGNIWDYATGKDSEFQARDLFFPKQESRRR